MFIDGHIRVESWGVRRRRTGKWGVHFQRAAQLNAVMVYRTFGAIQCGWGQGCLLETDSAWEVSLQKCSLTKNLKEILQTRGSYLMCQSWSQAAFVSNKLDFPGGWDALQIQEIWVQSLGQEDPLEDGMATHSSVLAWRIPWTEEPGGLQSIGSQIAGHDWSDWAQHSTGVDHVCTTLWIAFLKILL